MLFTNAKNGSGRQIARVCVLGSGAEKPDEPGLHDPGVNALLEIYGRVATIS